MTRRAHLLPLRILLVAAMLASCASSGVRVARSDQAAAPPPSTTAATSPTTTTTPAETTTATTDSTAPGDPVIPRIDWSACPDQPAPFQCGTVDVPLDYTTPFGKQLTLALIRLPAAAPSGRIGSLVLNPGGPGGSGVTLVENEGDTFPASVLDRFDIVGFDPRGVGASSRVTCPVSFDPQNGSYDACIPANRDVLPFLGTANVARDMDVIRAAIGDQQLTYLGFSYGTALGAVYADLFPNRVRAMVLDGAVDPDAGVSNTPTGGTDFYADQDFDETIAVFEALCDASTKCAAGPHSRDLLARVRHAIRDLPSPHFSIDGGLSRSDVDDLMVDAMYSAFDWPMLAIALKDADNGDASTLTALYNWLLYGYPADVTTVDDEDFSNIAIRCADFADRGSGSYDCADFPDSATPLPIIAVADTPNPVLVVGTKDDPATPARYAPKLAKALGHAVSIEWQGAGHTATLTSQCITDIVAAYLVDISVPADGATCPFITGTTGDSADADAVFAETNPEMSTDSLATVLGAAGDSPAAAGCVAEQLIRRADQRLIVHELLGVESPQLIALRNVIEARCRAGG